MATPSLRRRPGPVGTRPRWLTVVAAVAAVTIVGAACGDSGGRDTIHLSQDDADLSPSAESLAPSEPPGAIGGLEFATFDGRTASTADYAGRPLVINFFAAFCAPCVSEMPDLEIVAREVAPDVAVLGLSQDSVREDALALVAETGVTYDIGWDPDLVVYRELGGIALPTTVFIDATGTVVEVHSGALSVDAFREKIAALKA